MVLVEEIVQGVLISDTHGKVILSNRLGCSILQINPDGNLKDSLPESCIDRNGFKSGQHTFILPNGKGRVLCTIKPIQSGNRVTEYLVMVEKLKDVLKSVNKMIGSTAYTSFAEIIGESPAMISSRRLGEKAALGDSTVLILGESGTGKELFARAIHTASARKHEAFIPINCAAIPDHLLESELFGYEEGAFTGARKGGYIGKFEMADRGTIFLDEIGDMSLHLQTKLLRVLEERVVDKIGSRQRMAIDVRIIAATHQDLEEQIKQGTFRGDLFYRLNVIPLKLPTLRDRKTDIPILTEHFLREIRNNRGLPKVELDAAVMRILQEWTWPGNVRELQNTLSYALQMASGNRIVIEDLPERFRSSEVFLATESYTPNTEKQCAGSSDPQVISPLDALEYNEIQRALKVFGKDVESARKALGISRATLYRKMKQYRAEQ